MLVLASPFICASLLSILKKEKVRKNLNACYKNGGATWSRIEETSKFGGGDPFKPRHIFLDKEVLNIHEAKEQSDIDASVKVIQTVIDEYKSQNHEYTQVKEVVIEEKDLKAKYHKVIVRWWTAENIQSYSNTYCKPKL